MAPRLLGLVLARCAMAKVRFPGYRACLAMMRKRDPQVAEDGFHWLLSRAAEYVDELMLEFLREQDQGLRFWLLELIAEAGSPKAFALFQENLTSGEVGVRDGAIRGLQKLNTPEARQALYDAGVRRRPTVRRRPR